MTTRERAVCQIAKLLYEHRRDVRWRFASPEDREHFLEKTRGAFEGRPLPGFDFDPEAYERIVASHA